MMPPLAVLMIRTPFFIFGMVVLVEEALCFFQEGQMDADEIAS